MAAAQDSLWCAPRLCRRREKPKKKKEKKEGSKELYPRFRSEQGERKRPRCSFPGDHGTMPCSSTLYLRAREGGVTPRDATVFDPRRFGQLFLVMEPQSSWSRAAGRTLLPRSSSRKERCNFSPGVATHTANLAEVESALARKEGLSQVLLSGSAAAACSPSRAGGGTLWWL